MACDLPKPSAELRMVLLRVPERHVGRARTPGDAASVHRRMIDEPIAELEHAGHRLVARRDDLLGR